MGEYSRKEKTVLTMTDAEFDAYINNLGGQFPFIENMEKRLRAEYGEVSDRAWSLIKHLTKRRIAAKSSIGYPLMQQGIGAFAEAAVELYPDISTEEILGFITRQALADFIAASQPFQDAITAMLEETQ